MRKKAEVREQLQFIGNMLHTLIVESEIKDMKRLQQVRHQVDVALEMVKVTDD